jgi:hypothetical protein
MARVRSVGFTRLGLAGKSDLAEIAILCAAEVGAAVVAIDDPRSEVGRFVGVEVVASYSDIKIGFDAIIVTDVACAQDTYEQAVEARGKDHVLAPALLGLRPQSKEDVA